MTPAFEGFAAKVRASFDRQDMMQTFGAELVSVTPGAVEIAAPVLKTSRQQHGFGHAALTFGLGDSAAGYAALSLLAESDEVLTAEMKINLMAPANGPLLRAKGFVIRNGRRLVVVGAEVWAGDAQVALLQGTMIPVRG